MRFLARLQPKGEGGEKFLGTVRSIAKSVIAEARNPKWTSRGDLEIDIFAQSPNDFELFLSAIQPLAEIVFSRNLSEVPPHMSKEELVEQAREYFNSERFWEAHEVLETAWRSLGGIEKSYVQGLILVCAAFVHDQKGELKVALGVLARANRQLSYEGEDYFGINVGLLKNDVASILGEGRFHIFEI